MILQVLLNMVLGAAILAAIIALWLGVQHLVRKSEGLPPDCDVLAQPGRGCPHCQLHGKCALERDIQEDTGK